MLHLVLRPRGQSAASASRTRLVRKFHSATWNLPANKAGAVLLNDNMRQIGAPRFTDADHALAKAVQKSLGREEVGMPTALTPLAPPAAAYTGGHVTDTADISWQAPTAVLLSAAYPPGIPNQAGVQGPHGGDHLGVDDPRRHPAARPRELPGPCRRWWPRNSSAPPARPSLR